MFSSLPVNKIFNILLKSSLVLFILYLYQASSYLHDQSKLVLAMTLFICLSLFFRSIKPAQIGTVTLFSFALYFGWGIYAQVTPDSDFKTFFHQSSSFATHFDFKTLFDSKSPPTTIYYAFFFYTLGRNYLTSYIASSIIWSIQIPLFYKALRNFEISKEQSKFVSLLYGLCPGIIFFATTISSESLFCFFIISGFYLISRAKMSSSLKYAWLSGLCFGLFFLTRSNAIVFIIPYMIYLFITQKRNTFFKAAFTIGILLPLFFQLELNKKYGERISFSSSPWGAYNFMVGTNRKSKGGFSVEDLELAGFKGPNKVSQAEASQKAISIAYERIMNDPKDFAIFATTVKLERLWYTDSQAINIGVVRSEKNEELKEELSTGKQWLDSCLYMFIYSSLVFLLYQFIISFQPSQESKKEDDLLPITLFPLVLLAGLHLFIEVQPRYHMPFFPFFALYTGLLIANLGKIKEQLIQKMTSLKKQSIED